MAEQDYLAPLDHGAGSSCRSLYALALLFPPKLSSHMCRLYLTLWVCTAPPTCGGARPASPSLRSGVVGEGGAEEAAESEAWWLWGGSLGGVRAGEV